MITPMLADFLKALREADLPISPAETLEAHRAIDLVGWEDRDLLKDSLSVTLAKSEFEKDRFDDCFERFFAAPEFDADKPSRSEESSDNDPSADGGEAGEGGQGEGGQGEAQGGDGEGQAGGGGGAAPSEVSAAQLGELSELSQMLLSNDRPGLEARMAESAENSGVREIVLFTQIGQFTRRIAEGMGLEDLDDDLADLRDAGQAGDRQADGLGQRLNALRGRMMDRIRDYVEQQLALQAAGKSRRIREELLEQVRLTNIERRDYQMMQELVRKMAKKLVVLHSRRRKKSHRGQLDVRRTLRKNHGYDGLIVEPQWRRTKIDRPDVHVMCDVSGSVANVARFLLMFLYSLQEVLPKVRAYAFAGELREVTKLFETRPIEEAVASVLEDFAYMPTDYGRSLMDFRDIALDDVDYRSTVIILGDARSNYSEPRTEIIKTLYDRSKRLIWLNPEGRLQWGSGDSEMLKYAPHCHQVEVCNSLRHLERIVDRVLRAAL
ncbi:VWA domain-containing protein [Minwuia sp.]|uniref:VWA domain-containing protein n=1 Tax=Minwuia sp. TaxID=2493630 RepID=UPI003A9523F7